MSRGRADGPDGADRSQRKVLGGGGGGGGDKGRVEALSNVVTGHPAMLQEQGDGMAAVREARGRRLRLCGAQSGDQQEQAGEMARAQKQVMGMFQASTFAVGC